MKVARLKKNDGNSESTNDLLLTSHGGGCCRVIFNAAYIGGSKPVKMQTKDLNINN